MGKKLELKVTVDIGKKLEHLTEGQVVQIIRNMIRGKHHDHPNQVIQDVAGSKPTVSVLASLVSEPAAHMLGPKRAARKK